MLSWLAGSDPDQDREQDKESTSIQDTFILTMKVCEVELLITPGQSVSNEKSLEHNMDGLQQATSLICLK